MIATIIIIISEGVIYNLVQAISTVVNVLFSRSLARLLILISIVIIY